MYAEVNLLSQGCFKRRLILHSAVSITICLFHCAITHSITPSSTKSISPQPVLLELYMERLGYTGNLVIYTYVNVIIEYHRMSSLKGTHKDPGVQLLHGTTLRITPRCLYNKSPPHTFAQGSSAQISVTASPGDREPPAKHHCLSSQKPPCSQLNVFAQLG